MKTGLTIAIMQPYFIPYAGYFRLLAASDLFVIYDCVQFTRRGWLHRNKLHDATGNAEWFTLPLRKAPQDVLIRDLTFREDARAELLKQARRFPVLNAAVRGDDPELSHLLFETGGTPLDYILRLLEWTARRVDVPWRIVRSSTLAIDPETRGEDRILAIAAALGATRYVNAPGGVDLYDPQRFREKGIKLHVLAPYLGSYASILERVLTSDAAEVRAEILGQLA